MDIDNLNSIHPIYSHKRTRTEYGDVDVFQEEDEGSEWQGDREEKGASQRDDEEDSFRDRECKHCHHHGPVIFICAPEIFEACRHDSEINRQIREILNRSVTSSCSTQI